MKNVIYLENNYVKIVSTDLPRSIYKKKKNDERKNYLCF